MTQPRRASLGRCLFAGLMCGGGAGVGANLVAAAISSVTAHMYEELAPIPIAGYAVGTSLVAGLLFCVVARRSENPPVLFGAATVFAASLASVWILTCRPLSFAEIAIPAELTVVVVMIGVVPRLASAPGRRGPAGPTLSIQ